MVYTQHMHSMLVQVQDERLDAPRLCPTIEILISLEQPLFLIRAMPNILDLQGEKND